MHAFALISQWGKIKRCGCPEENEFTQCFVNSCVRLSLQIIDCKVGYNESCVSYWMEQHSNTTLLPDITGFTLETILIVHLHKCVTFLVFGSGEITTESNFLTMMTIHKV